MDLGGIVSILEDLIGNNLKLIFFEKINSGNCPCTWLGWFY